jgi:hypothetical protein
MKLNLLFIVMDLLTLLAYPIVFVQGKLYQLLRSKQSMPLPSQWVGIPVSPVR